MTASLTANPLSAVAAIAEAMLAGATSLISGSGQISRLAMEYAPKPLDDDFAIFFGFWDRTFDFPVGEVRRYWAVEALAQKDAELAALEEEFRPQAFVACRHLIARFGSHQ
jgi:hypothetical protein